MSNTDVPQQIIQVGKGLKRSLNHQFTFRNVAKSHQSNKSYPPIQKKSVIHNLWTKKEKDSTIVNND